MKGETNILKQGHTVEENMEARGLSQIQNKY